MKPPGTRAHLALAAVWVSLIALITTQALTHLSALAVTEHWLEDLRAHLLPTVATEKPGVAVLLIPDATVAAMECRSPIDRRYLADRLRLLRQSGLAALGIDILFDQATPHDEPLLEALNSLPFPVVMAWLGEEDGLVSTQQAELVRFIGERKRGAVTFLVDTRDGIARSLPMLSRDGDDATIAPFAQALAAAAGLTHDVDLPLELAYPPQLPNGQRVVDAYAIDHLDALLTFNPRMLDGKIVLLGSGSATNDLHVAPYSRFDSKQRKIPGVMLHAHAVVQLLQGYEIQRTSAAVSLLLGLACGAAGWLLALSGAPLLLHLLGALSGVLGYAGLALATYGSSQLLLPVTGPVLALLAAFAGSAVTTGRKLRQQRALIRREFSRYVPQEVVARLVKNPDDLTLRGEKRELTFLFSDIADFTTLCESLEPETVVTLMNIYLDGMSNVVNRHGGTIDKFIGDAVVAFFNAPLEQPNHRERAVSCALEMQHFADEFAIAQEAKEIPVGRTRIGVHTGLAVIGNIGGELRYDYTALGDAVNTAARLEGANKYTATSICVSGATIEGASGVLARPIAQLLLKGKREPITAFEPLEKTPANRELAARHTAAYGMFSTPGAHARLISALQALQEEHPDDSLIDLHLCRALAGKRNILIRLDKK